MIKYRSATKVFGAGKGEVVAVNEVTLDIEPGHLVVFLGPSGCGKTTLLRLTNRLEALTRGDILVKDEPIASFDKVKLRQSMGYVIQQIGLFPNKTIAGNIGMVPKLLGWEKERTSERVDELLGMMNLDAQHFRSRYPAELSGGQQQRVGVARALAADPDILLMDEPFGAVDPINRAIIQDEFLRLHARLKKTVAFVSHDVHEAIKMADKIAIFDEGRLLQYDRPEVLLTRPNSRFIADFLGTDRALKVLGLHPVKDAMKRGAEGVVEASAKAEEALGFMGERGMEDALVVRGGKPVGLVSRKSLEAETGPVGDLAEPLREAVEETRSLKDALSSMLMHNSRLLWVTDENGEFAGTISYPDIQKYILETYREQANLC